jgi:alpha-1,3/alpha-1,6-mannosyltransferase
MNFCNKGTLEVVVAGDWFPREIGGRFQLPCAILRFIVTSAALLWDHKKTPFDVIFVDQISATIPMLRWSKAKVRSCVLVFNEIRILQT